MPTVKEVSFPYCIVARLLDDKVNCLIIVNNCIKGKYALERTGASAVMCRNYCVRVSVENSTASGLGSHYAIWHSAAPPHKKGAAKMKHIN